MVASMARRYLLRPLPPAGPAQLPEEIAHHLGRVMRVAVGDPVVLFDGEGRECRSRVSSVAGRGKSMSVQVEVEAAYAVDREPPTAVEVAFAVPKGNRGDWVFEHGTEVGIAAFHPILTERSTGRERSARWPRILAAAAGQCDRARVPTLSPAQTFDQFLEAADLPGERYLADAAGPPLTRSLTERALLMVGPEGGLTEEETAAALAQGFEPRNLGVTTLRTETAVLAGAVLLLQGSEEQPES